jgi:hypothetical protein
LGCGRPGCTEPAWKRSSRSCRAFAGLAPGPQHTSAHAASAYVMHSRRAIWVCDRHWGEERRGERRRSPSGRSTGGPGVVMPLCSYGVLLSSPREGSISVERALMANVVAAQPSYARTHRRLGTCRSLLRWYPNVVPTPDGLPSSWRCEPLLSALFSGYLLVEPAGIEPASTALQTGSVARR